MSWREVFREANGTIHVQRYVTRLEDGKLVPETDPQGRPVVVLQVDYNGDEVIRIEMVGELDFMGRKGDRGPVPKVSYTFQAGMPVTTSGTECEGNSIEGHPQELTPRMATYFAELGRELARKEGPVLKQNLEMCVNHLAVPGPDHSSWRKPETADIPVPYKSPAPDPSGMKKIEELGRKYFKE